MHGCKFTFNPGLNAGADSTYWLETCSAGKHLKLQTAPTLRNCLALYVGAEVEKLFQETVQGC